MIYWILYLLKLEVIPSSSAKEFEQLVPNDIIIRFSLISALINMVLLFPLVTLQLVDRGSKTSNHYTLSTNLSSEY